MSQALDQLSRGRIARGKNGPRVRSAKRKKRFLEALRQCGIATEAAACVGESISTIYGCWRRDDPEFVDAMDKATEEGDEQLRLECNQEVKKRAFSGSDGMLYFLTKSRDFRFKDNHQVNIGILSPGSVKILMGSGQNAIPEETGENGR